MANDFSADSNCIALYRFETGALTTDSKGSETLSTSAAAPSADNAQFKEGSWSALFNKVNNQFFYRTDTNLGSTFPLKSGTSNKTISIAGWIHFVSLPASGQFMRLWSKTNYTAANSRTIGVDVFNNAGNSVFDSDFGKTDGTYSNNYGHASVLSTGTWYHLTFGYRDSDKALRFFLRDTSGNTIGSDVSTTTTDNIGLFSGSDFMLGAVNTGASSLGPYFDGYMDEVVVFSKLLTATDATNIAKGLYSGSGSAGQTMTATAGSYAQSGTSSILRVGSPLYLRYRK